MKKRIQAPTELFVVVFPCGDGAVQEGTRLTNGRACCERGHDSFEVHIYRPYPPERSCTAFRSPVRGNLRLA